MGTGSFKATLVWMDPPASLNSRVNLVNDLDLKVEKSGTTYYPNGKNQADTLNNVEMVESPATPGTYTVSVTARKIGSLPTQPGQPPAQPYALVVSGPFNAATTQNPTPNPTPAPTPNPGPSPAPTPITANGYTKLTTGNCAANQKLVIKDLATCQAAAAALQLTDTTATEIYTAERPEGCYYFKGVSLVLSSNPANAGRGSDTDGREQICKPASKEYEKISTGSCADRGLYAINEPELCEFAAIELGLADTSVAYISSTDKPEGCYFKPLLLGNALFLSTNPTNTGKGAVGGREPICSAIKPSSG